MGLGICHVEEIFISGGDPSLSRDTGCLATYGLCAGR